MVYVLNPGDYLDMVWQVGLTPLALPEELE